MINNAPKSIPWIVHLTTYPPRECGIATFSADLISYSKELFSGQALAKVVALNDPSGPVPAYPDEVLFSIQDSDPDEYRSAAARLNAMPEVSIVSIQHEFGIFGGEYGEHLLAFLDELTKPVVVTFHTVLPNPPDGMKAVVERIGQHADRIVVMTETSKNLLISAHGVPEHLVQVIPHGIHPQRYSTPNAAKARLGLSGHRVLMTFGLLGRGKGIEYAIQAMPRIVEQYPDTRYLIVGATHPVVLRREGDVYRDELKALIARLGMEEHVMFHNAYLATDDLLEYLRAADIYLSVSQNPDQAVSGTLSYALGTGRPVLSTAFAQARELITQETGVLVGFGGHDEISSRVLELFSDPERLSSMSKAAYFRTRSMTWPNVALSYMGIYSSILPSLTGTQKYLLPVKLDYIKRMTDDYGIFQFAHMSEPDSRWGYTLDDNARALVMACWYARTYPVEDVEHLAEVYLSFIERSALPDGSFKNYFTAQHAADDALNDAENLEDAGARALWALGVAASSTLPEALRTRASELFARQLPLRKLVKSPRAAGFLIKACATYLDAHENAAEPLERMRKYAEYLVDLYERSCDGDWRWFEESLTYSNAVLPEAMLVAYAVLQEPRYREVGKASLDFLVAHSFEGDVCVPVGQAGWYLKGGKKQRYDQQPEEVAALVLALHEMTTFSANPVYREKMLLAFDWFLGNNLSQQIVYTHTTGGSYDGVGEQSINLNQGSESTISYLLARLIVEME